MRASSPLYHTHARARAQAKKNYDTLKTSLRHFVASEPAVPAFAAIFSVALNEATTCEMEEASEEAEKESRRESKKKGEAEVVA